MTLALVCAGALYGCAVGAPRTDEQGREVAVVEAVATVDQAPAAPPPAAPPPQGAAAYLVEEARSLARAGDYERAAAQVERALRIEPGNPWLYLALAEIRYAAGAPDQGRALTGRARALAGGDPEVAATADALTARHATGRRAP